MPDARREGESQSDCVDRFLGDPGFRQEFPESDQRLAVAIRECRKANMADKTKADLGCPPGSRHVEGKGCLEEAKLQDVGPEVCMALQVKLQAFEPIGDFSIHIFGSAGAAEIVAGQLGCQGSHMHDIEGQTMFMPCPDHATYNRVVGLASLQDNPAQLAVHPLCPPGTHRSGNMCVKNEEASLNDGRGRILEDGENLIFHDTEMESKSLQKKTIGDGVSASVSNETNIVHSIIFDKSKHDFESATTFLKSIGRDPSDIRHAALEEGSESLMFVENVTILLSLQAEE